MLFIFIPPDLSQCTIFCSNFLILQNTKYSLETFPFVCFSLAPHHVHILWSMNSRELSGRCRNTNWGVSRAPLTFVQGNREIIHIEENQGTNPNFFLSKVPLFLVCCSSQWLGKKLDNDPCNTCILPHTATKILFMYSFSGNCVALVPTSTWAIYIFPGSVHIFGCSKIDRPILETYKSLTDIRV